MYNSNHNKHAVVIFICYKTNASNTLRITEDTILISSYDTVTNRTRYNQNASLWLTVTDNNHTFTVKSKVFVLEQDILIRKIVWVM